MKERAETGRTNRSGFIYLFIAYWNICLNRMDSEQCFSGSKVPCDLRIWGQGPFSTGWYYSQRHLEAHQTDSTNRKGKVLLGNRNVLIWGLCCLLLTGVIFLLCRFLFSSSSVFPSPLPFLLPLFLLLCLPTISLFPSLFFSLVLEYLLVC